MEIKEFINKLEHYYECEEACPSYFIDYVREAEEEYGLKFDNVVFVFGTWSYWTDHGYRCDEFDYYREFDMTNIPDEIANRGFYVSGIDYNKEENSIDVTMCGKPRTKAEMIADRDNKIALDEWLKNRRYFR